MEVGVATCSSCRQWVSRDGREEHVILLTTTTAATVSWARSMAMSAAEGTPLTTCTTRWLRVVLREMAAGVLPRDCPTRSGRVLRTIVLVSVKLMVSKLPAPLFSCHHGMEADGGCKVVSAESIWVGFGSGVKHVQFQHVTKQVPENRRAIRAAYLVRGESVRRVIRDLMKPGKDVKLLARTTRPAELAVGLLLPDALPEKRVMEATASERAIGALLSSVYDTDEAAHELLVALKVALSTFKARNRAEAERKSVASRHLASYLEGKVARTASTPTTVGIATASARPGSCAAEQNGSSPAALSHPQVSPPMSVASTPRPRSQLSFAGVKTAARAGMLSPVEPRVAEPVAGKAAKKRQPDCGRKAFVGGKGDVDTASPFLRSAVNELRKDGRRELLSFVTAITIDSVVLPFRHGHAGVLRAMEDKLQGPDCRSVVGQLLAKATSGDALPADSDMTPVVQLLRDLRFVQLGMRSCMSLFAVVPGLSGALARGLRCIADAIDLFVLEWRNGPEQTRQYEKKWGGGGSSQVQLSDTFKEAYPAAFGGGAVDGHVL